MADLMLAEVVAMVREKRAGEGRKRRQLTAPSSAPEETLALLQKSALDYPDFEKGIAAFVRAETAFPDPLEGQALPTAGRMLNRIRTLLGNAE